MASHALLDLSRQELASRLEEWGEPRFRADQIWRAVYRELVVSYEAITPLPRSLRQAMSQRLPFGSLEPLERVESEDQSTSKVLFRLEDAETIEAVLMRYERRQTVCLSTQIGCAIGCPFCATGRGGLRRDLSVGEIVGQVLFFARELARGGERLTNVVYMGMGEPLLNYDATIGSIRALNDPDGFGLRARGFTVSTAGIVPGIERLAGEEFQVNLAVSLHAANDRLRNQLVPINRRYLLSELLHACRAYVERTHRRISFEIALIDGVNDSLENAREVVALLDGLLCHVNLIALNPVEGCAFRPSPRAKREAFLEELRQRGLEATLRLGRGTEVEAGCGQLRGRQPKASGPSPGADHTTP